METNVNNGKSWAKGLPNPKRNYTRETSGVVHRGYADAFLDVKAGCVDFLRGRVKMGLMVEKEAMPTSFTYKEKRGRR